MHYVPLLNHFSHWISVKILRSPALQHSNSNGVEDKSVTEHALSGPEKAETYLSAVATYLPSTSTVYRRNEHERCVLWGTRTRIIR